MAGRIQKRKSLNYAKWGYFFILPFFVVYVLFSLYPLLTTFAYSFQDVQQKDFLINNGWNNFANYRQLFKTNDWLKYFGTTMIMQFMGFVPQLIVSLLLAVWFTDSRLKIKGASFFKAVIYMPNLIMATAMATLVGGMFDAQGPIGHAWSVKHPTDAGIFSHKWIARWIVALVNFIMWFGNTTILLMAGVMGIDDSIFEAATIDGAGPIRTFKDITFPLLLPIFVYVFLTSLIGGIQMFDVPNKIMPNDIGSKGGSDYQVRTIIMYLNAIISANNKNYGVAGALCVLLFIITLGLSFVIFKFTSTDMDASKAKKKAAKKAARAKKVNA